MRAVGQPDDESVSARAYSKLSTIASSDFWPDSENRTGKVRSIADKSRTGASLADYAKFLVRDSFPVPIVCRSRLPGSAGFTLDDPDAFCEGQRTSDDKGPLDGPRPKDQVPRTGYGEVGF